MDQVLRLILLSSISFTLAGACNKPLPNPGGTTPTTQGNYNLPLQIKNSLLFVEVADTNQKRQQGLSGREPLTEEQGMLFDFREFGTTRPGFWMKDMKFNLDLIWIKSNRVIGITPDVPAPKNTSDELPEYYPPEIIDMVLEVRAGWSAQHNLQIGDPVSLINTPY